MSTGPAMALVALGAFTAGTVAGIGGLAAAVRWVIDDSDLRRDQQCWLAERAPTGGG